MSFAETRMSAREVYDMGKQYSITTTIHSDLIIFGGNGPFIDGQLANSNTAGLFLDFCSQVGCNALGHNHPAIRQAIKEQNETGLLMSCGNDWFNKQAVLLMKKLCEITPGDSNTKRAFLCNSGTEAVEAAIKMCQARRHREGDKKRKKFVAFQSAFHGRTGNSLSLNCSKKYHTEAFFADRGYLDIGDKDRAIPVRHIPFPDHYDFVLKSAFKGYLDIICLHDVSAIFIELVQGEGGIRVFDKECLDLLIARCRKEGIYIVVDEVQTGLMRAGKMFACDHYGLEPDIICVAKALSGGAIPIGATVAKKEFDFEPGQHSNTFGGSPLACRVALALIKELENLDPSALQKNIDILSAFAPEGLGMMRRIIFGNSQRRDEIVNSALNKMLLLIGAGERAIRLMPPLNISEQYLRLGIDILKKCMQ